MKRYQLNGKLQVVKVTEAPEKIEFRDEEEGSKFIDYDVKDTHSIKIQLEKTEKLVQIIQEENDKLKSKKIRKILEKQNSPQTIKECKNTEEEDLKRFGGSKSNFSDEEFADSFNTYEEKGEDIFKNPFDMVNLYKGQFSFAQEMQMNPYVKDIMNYLKQIKTDPTLTVDELRNILNQMRASCEWSPMTALKPPGNSERKKKKAVFF